MPYKAKPQDLLIHFLNVGQGDAIVIGFPAGDDGKRRHGVVDCYNSTKVIGYLDKLMPADADKKRLYFICATHPHLDHIKGINKLLKHAAYKPEFFWDCGFRHATNTYRDILTTISKDKKISMIRVSSGMERYYGKVRVTALAPSVMLRNRYATYGVDINNASIVLRLEHHAEDVLVMRSQEYGKDIRESAEAIREAGKSVAILAGDAEFDSWARVTQEYPRLERTKENEPLVKKMVNYLACSVIKVAHHGSMHSTSLDVYEKMIKPSLAVISNEQKLSDLDAGGRTLTRGLYPHPSTVHALQECGTRILTTDGSYESEPVDGGGVRDAENAHPGSVVVAIPPGKGPKYVKFDDTVGQTRVPDAATEFKSP